MTPPVRPDLREAPGRVMARRVPAEDLRPRPHLTPVPNAAPNGSTGSASNLRNDEGVPLAAPARLCGDAMLREDLHGRQLGTTAPAAPGHPIPVQPRPDGVGVRLAPPVYLPDPFSVAARTFKRTLDIVVAGLALLLAAPLLAVTMIAVALESEGSVIFSQERIGQAGRPFLMHKIRSMRAGDDKDHRLYAAKLILGDQVDTENGVYKLVSNPRITRVGRFIRRFSIDELPQLWNVLRGQMSLVGPRPPLAYEVELYDDRARQRLRVKPGMTGLWQVSGRCRLSFSEMVALDVAYVETWRIWSDLVILAKTPLAAISARGAA